MMLIAVICCLLVVGLLMMRGNELFLISVRNGKVLVVRGRVPVSLLQDFREIVNRPTVKRGTIKARKTEYGTQIFVSGDIDEGREQRMRNTFQFYPASKLRSAPIDKERTMGQLTGIVWLAWILDRSNHG
ncbi:MAG TPA: DUF3634 family protein [Kofleriaceae bacterium]|jgi:hypothetical protein